MIERRALARLCGSLAAGLWACWALADALPPGAPGTQRQPAAASAPAHHLQAGSSARDRVVAIGQDLWIDGEAHHHAVAINGNARISGRVGGDLIVLGGDAVLLGTAKVGGDVYVLGGRIDSAEGALIEGRSVAYPAASDVWVALVAGPTLGQAGDPRLVIGAKLALLAFWTLVMLLLFALAHRELVVTSESIRDRPFHNFFLGLTGVAAMVLTALFFSALSGAVLGVPLLVLVAVIALVLRFWGMVAIFHALGAWLGKTLFPKLRLSSTPLQAATYGLIALGALKLVPYLGLWAWSLATFIGVGAALQTRLGRRDAWLDG
jgi:hypothetical protein